MTFFCSRIWRKYWNEGTLMTLMTSAVTQRQLWRPFHKTSSKIVLKGGLGAGIGAQLPKGSTLKATTVVFSNEVCSIFTAMSSRTLLSDYVQRNIYVRSRNHSYRGKSVLHTLRVCTGWGGGGELLNIKCELPNSLQFLPETFFFSFLEVMRNYYHKCILLLLLLLFIWITRHFCQILMIPGFSLHVFEGGEKLKTSWTSV